MTNFYCHYVIKLLSEFRKIYEHKSFSGIIRETHKIAMTTHSTTQTPHLIQNNQQTDLSQGIQSLGFRELAHSIAVEVKREVYGIKIYQL